MFVVVVEHITTRKGELQSFVKPALFDLGVE
jgi:hypothetical protein